MKYKNRTFQLLLALYTFLLLAVSTAACYFSYTQKKEEFFSAVDVIFRELKEEYSNITDNFWQLYMPIFESNDELYALFVRYFSGNEPLDPLDRQLLANAMQSILMRDSRVQWVALISDCRDINYIMFQSSPSLSTLTDDFPYWRELKNKPQTLEVYQMETLSDGSSQYQTFALCGNSPKYMGNGKLIAGYSTSFFEQICQNTAVSANDLSFQLTFRDRVLFSSNGSYETSLHPADAQNFTGITSSDSGTSLYIRREICANRYSQLSYQVPWKTIATRFHKNTPIILITINGSGLFPVHSIFIMAPCKFKSGTVSTNALSPLPLELEKIDGLCLFYAAAKTLEVHPIKYVFCFLLPHNIFHTRLG